MCAIRVRGCKEKWCNVCVLGMVKMGPIPSSLCCIPLCQIVVAFQGTTFSGIGKHSLGNPCWFSISHISWWWGYMPLNLWFPNVFDDSVCGYPCPLQLLVISTCIENQNNSECFRTQACLWHLLEKFHCFLVFA